MYIPDQIAPYSGEIAPYSD